METNELPPMPAGWPSYDEINQALGMFATALVLPAPDPADDVATAAYIDAQGQAAGALERITETVATMAWRCRRDARAATRAVAALTR